VDLLMGYLLLADPFIVGDEGVAVMIFIGQKAEIK
jgi:hypothetical protein